MTATFAALVASGIGPRQALVFHAASGEVPKDLLRQTRAWPDEEWAATEAWMREQAGSPQTARSLRRAHDVRQQIEDTTDRRRWRRGNTSARKGCDRLLELGKPLSKRLVENGGIPGR